MAAEDDKKAWEEYLGATKLLRGRRYEKLEPWAWSQLQAKLGNLRVKRKVA